MSRRRTLLVALVCLSVPHVVDVRPAAAQSSIVDLLNRYERGDMGVALVNSDLDWLADELVAHGERWAAELTGGRVHTQVLLANVVGYFRHAFSDFRQSYVLRYTPTGVARDGWHEIKVEVPGHRRATIRARKGYFGGERPVTSHFLLPTSYFPLPTSSFPLPTSSFQLSCAFCT